MDAISGADNIVFNVDDYLIGSEPSDSDIDVVEQADHYEEFEGDGVSYIKLSYNDVRNHINKSYEQDIVHRYSSALDILASYIKGQNIRIRVAL